MRARSTPALPRRCCSQQPVCRRTASQYLCAAGNAALALLCAACSDLALPDETALTTEQLLILAQQPGAPAPSSKDFWVFNSRQSVTRIYHPDNYNTLYLELSFPSHSLASLAGTALSGDDSVLVTVEPRPGTYGFTLSPPGLSFNSGALPTATLSFAIYGDPGSAAGSGTYETAADYTAALDVWRRVSGGRWQPALGSAPRGADALCATVESPGAYVLAAPR